MFGVNPPRSLSTDLLGFWCSNVDKMVALITTPFFASLAFVVSRLQEAWSFAAQGLALFPFRQSKNEE